ncbi:MAG: alcohol dehydrogenase catalytic domain-containing protein [Ilumatobacteraceae bacterium]
MRAVRRTGNGIEMVEVPEPEGDGVVVHVQSAGICGSDLHGFGSRGITIGHEFGGLLDDGTPVAVRPNIVCGTCEFCLRGEENSAWTRLRRLIGMGLDGGMAERIVVPEQTLFPLPVGLPVEACALVEPLSVSLHAVHRGGIEPGMRVHVIGAGSIGLTAVLAARSMGVDVDVLARHPHQRDAADALGGIVRAEAGYDVVIDSVGSQAAIEESIDRARYGGVVVEVGGFWTPVSIGPLSLLKEVSMVPAIYAAHHHGESEFAAAAAVIAMHPDACSVLVTHRFPLERAAEAFEAAADKSSGAIKVQLTPLA